MIKVLDLEGRVDTLQTHGNAVDEQLVARQRQVDHQAGQQKVPVTVVQASSRDPIDNGAEGAVVNVLSRLTTDPDDPAKS